MIIAHLGLSYYRYILLRLSSIFVDPPSKYSAKLLYTSVKAKTSSCCKMGESPSFQQLFLGVWTPNPYLTPEWLRGPWFQHVPSGGPFLATDVAISLGPPGIFFRRMRLSRSISVYLSWCRDGPDRARGPERPVFEVLRKPHLVGGSATPLKNMTSSIGMMT